ncbi:unnamed protein product [Rotaria sordida]|uniref:Protein NO VEIN C-terminal domain-containing protein n=2 Tax=Rotaria sordida TaxID=392033 RepID=A0A819HIN2_9BILA|nr:unnamed protein product [Rotaria sordida]CAF3904401.1 unnamed protein product [Rotaria sordida]
MYHYFPYIDNIKLNSELILILNINDRIIPQDIISRLLEYINNSTYTALSNIDTAHMDENDKQEKINILLDNPPKQPYQRKFIENLSTMNRLYNFLYNELTNDKLWDDPTHLLPEHYLMKHFYKELEVLFTNILQIPLKPNVKSYLELLKNYSQKNITDELTNNVWKIFENLHDEDNDSIKKLFKHQSLIPSMTQFGWIKLDDKPYIPDDKYVGQLFELESLPIIKLPESGLTIHQRKFLDKLQCKNLSEILKSNVNVTNVKQSDDLKQFYTQALPFISNYLYNEIDLFDESYNKRKLNKIFLQMKFFIVDSIEVTYGYNYKSFNHTNHCYLDQKFKKFYLLKTHHYSQSIDTMIQFIINDTVIECQYKRDKLDKYYRKLLTAYSKDQLKQNITDDNDDSKPVWILNIDNEEQDENNVIEDIDNDDTKLNIHSDPTRIDQILNEEKIVISKSKSEHKQTYQQSNTKSSSYDIHIHDETNKSTIDDKVNKNDSSTTTVQKEHQQPRNLYHNNENVSIEWLNKTSETGLPYDIKINFIDKPEKPHQIKVKTTSKHIDDYQFSISIQEVEEILKNPTTYYIYRVNLNNRSLTIIEDIKLNLSDKRQLELKMNVLTTNDLDSRK